ncbi:MAG: hypothetical protein KDD70_02185 [Bdellovibrionales bacterium]|nr:hypothetical protein [Bdellovibrionales bacterium]
MLSDAEGFHPDVRVPDERLALFVVVFEVPDGLDRKLVCTARPKAEAQAVALFNPV